jgi:CDP-glucose 4,6-dehydratase
MLRKPRLDLWVSEDILTVKEIVALAVSLWGQGDYRIDSAAQPHEATLLRLDCSKAYHFLSWRPVYGASQAMEETTAWYRKFYSEASSDKEMMYEFSSVQISRYMNLAREKGILWATSGETEA